MFPRWRVVPILALALFPIRASPAPVESPPSTTQYVPIVEPGKPMRFQAMPPPTAAAEAAPDPCDLDSPQDRRTPTSSRCMQCHDGSKAANATTGHRFDIEYQIYGKELRLEPEKFNPKVVLADGKVTCMSCHEPQSTLRYHLAAPTDGEVAKRLCVACHLR
jgi:hypothetical protein